MTNHSSVLQRRTSGSSLAVVARLVLAVSGGLLLLALSSCAGAPQNQRVLNVGMLLAQGGLGDRSFNDSAYAGLQEAQRQFGIRFETADFASDEANLESLRRFARQEYDLIIGVGFETAAFIEKVAAEFPERKFASIDTVVKGDNVASIVYREQEGDFLMGVLAAMLTTNRKVGFIGGADIAITRRIESGFKQGVAYQDKGVQVLSDLAGTFADPERGKVLALAQYQAGVDVIYNGAGRTGLGIIEAAKETGRLTIGTSGDQRYLAPGNVVGNRPKRVDAAVLMLVSEIRDGAFSAGQRSLGLKEGGLALGPFDEKLVSGAMLSQLESLEQKIIRGEIVVQIPGE